MSKYLYGAAVEGIQDFIFQTSKLREIIGASELVEKICTTKFCEVANIKKDDENIILNAAGNIKYLFDSKENCEKFVKEFPKKVMEMAPGITIIQAVVKFENGGLNDALRDLNIRLREQLNKVSMPFEIGFMGTERARRTGGVAFQKNPLFNEDEIVCEATIKKIDESKTNTLFKKIAGEFEYDDKKLLTNVDSLFKNDNKTWLAVIHADGNNLGVIIQNLHQSLENSNDDNMVQKVFKIFSERLEISTKKSAQKAFEKVVKSKEKEWETYPIRPIILGGDDLTVIIRADLALDFTTEFLKEFQNQTKVNLKFLKDVFSIDGFENGITACAGISYVQKSYPFHYAIDLAEKLCKHAKRFVKDEVKYDGLVPKSSFAFFKVKDSFIVSDFDEMRKRSLTVEDLNFDYGPYLIEEYKDFAHIGELMEKIKVIDNISLTSEDKEETNGVSKLRQWVSAVFKDKASADFMQARMSIVNEKFYNEIKPKDIKNGKSIIYDIIQLHSFKN